MIANVSIKGQMVIPEAIREQARIKTGDQLDVGYINGLIVLRKRRALTPARVRSLLLAGRELPEMTPADETAVTRAVQRVRSRVKGLQPHAASHVKDFQPHVASHVKGLEPHAASCVKGLEPHAAGRRKQ
jgi:AbrB family looped-hinge helix DNA binding protein